MSEIEWVKNWPAAMHGMEFHEAAILVNGRNVSMEVSWCLDPEHPQLVVGYQAKVTGASGAVLESEVFEHLSSAKEWAESKARSWETC